MVTFSSDKGAPMQSIFSRFLALQVLIVLCLVGCSSLPVNITPTPAVGYKVLGKAEGSACGNLGIAGTAYYFIPVGLNSRIQRAYNNALESVPGATSLVNVEMRESWFWWVLATCRCVTIRGDAVKGEV